LKIIRRSKKNNKNNWKQTVAYLLNQVLQQFLFLGIIVQYQFFQENKDNCNSLFRKT
jgi:hypothetical protein